MRIKLPILTGVVALTVGGIALAAQGSSIFTSSANPLSTIGEMVATSLWDANAADDQPVVAGTIGKHFNIAATFGKILTHTFPSVPVGQSTYVPSVNLQPTEYNQINSNLTVGDFGYSQNDNINSGNSFVGGGVGGGGSNWGSVPIPPICPGMTGVGSCVFGLGGSSGTGLGGFFGIGLGGSSGPGLGGSSGIGLASSSSFGLASPTPEPGEWLLMLFGFGLAGYGASLRKQRNMAIKLEFLEVS